MPTLDLHTHSAASIDGALTLEHYRRMLETGALTHIAITDHNTINFALTAQAQLGSVIIVGEEIATAQGELIGLYLKTAIAPGLSARDTATAIHAQGGLVYVPHPFDTSRGSLDMATLEALADAVDIIEVHNGRSRLRSPHHDPVVWAKRHQVATAASSDAHGWHGWGRTSSTVTQAPSASTLAEALRQNPSLNTGYVGLRGLLYPSLNRMRRAHVDK